MARRSATPTTESALSTSPSSAPTRERLLAVGLALLLEHGYHGMGTQAVLDAARAPKGSFYHHFRDKEDFVLQVVDEYMKGVHAALDASMGDASRPPLERVRGFFGMVEQGYESDGYLGCLLGGLGQELSGTSRVFAERISACLGYIASRLSVCLAEAQEAGDLSPDADPQAMASVLVDCWEGAALRSRLTGSPAPLHSMLDFYFAAAAPR
jgi:TetR/AcrR family transcriptional repressor of nem operon